MAIVKEVNPAVIVNCLGKLAVTSIPSFQYSAIVTVKLLEVHPDGLYVIP